MAEEGTVFFESGFGFAAVGAIVPFLAGFAGAAGGFFTGLRSTGSPLLLVLTVFFPDGVFFLAMVIQAPRIGLNVRRNGSHVPCKVRNK